MNPTVTCCTIYVPVLFLLLPGLKDRNLTLLSLLSLNVLKKLEDNILQHFCFINVNYTFNTTLNLGNSTPQGIAGNVWIHFGDSHWGESLLVAPRAAWVAANHPTMHCDRRDPQKSIPLQMVTLPTLKNTASPQPSLVKSIQINDKYQFKFIINW